MLRLVKISRYRFWLRNWLFLSTTYKEGCRVTGIEINPAAKLNYIVRAFVFCLLLCGLACSEMFWNIFAIRGKCLKKTQLLKSEGYVVASIPNIAHGAVRLALLQGDGYTELGILDSTHLRFFTRKTVEELFERSGYFYRCYRLTKLPVFSDSSEYY